MPLQTAEMILVLEQQEACKARFVEARTIKVDYNGHKCDRWVATFNLTDHATARRAYMWRGTVTLDGLLRNVPAGPEFQVVLHGDGVVSSDSALNTIVRKIMHDFYDSV